LICLSVSLWHCSASGSATGFARQKRTRNQLFDWDSNRSRISATLSTVTSLNQSPPGKNRTLGPFAHKPRQCMRSTSTTIFRLCSSTSRASAIAMLSDPPQLTDVPPNRSLTQITIVESGVLSAVLLASMIFKLRAHHFHYQILYMSRTVMIPTDRNNSIQ